MRCMNISLAVAYFINKMMQRNCYYGLWKKTCGKKTSTNHWFQVVRIIPMTAQMIRRYDDYALYNIIFHCIALRLDLHN